MRIALIAALIASTTLLAPAASVGPRDIAMTTVAVDDGTRVHLTWTPPPTAGPSTVFDVYGVNAGAATLLAQVPYPLTQASVASGYTEYIVSAGGTDDACPSVSVRANPLLVTFDIDCIGVVRVDLP